MLTLALVMLAVVSEPDASVATLPPDAAGVAELAETIDAGELPDAGPSVEPPPAFDAGAPATSDAGLPLELPKGFTGIAGRVIDSSTGEGLIEATVKVIEGGRKSALTDLEGRFRLKLPPGKYALRVFYELYQGRKLTEVVVSPGQVTSLEVALDRDRRAVQEVVVEAKADKRSESALLQERKKAAVVQDTVGAQELARTPDSTAGDAAKRVVSVTLQDGKYVFIRGLGGRYAQTLINSTIMPSPEPDDPSVPLDLFPTALVSNLTVVKTYSPELPGQFGGGSLTVDTATFPTALDVRLKAQLSGDSATTFRDRPSAPSSLSEAFGFRDPARDLPVEIPRDRTFQASNDPAKPGVTAEQQQAGARALQNRWTPGTVSAAPNGSVGAQVGDTVRLGKDVKLGFLGAVQWGRKELTRRTFVADTSFGNDGLKLENPTNSVVSSVSASTSGLLNAGLTVGSDHEVSVLALALTNAENQAITAEGLDTVSSMQRQVNDRLQFTQRVLTFNQVKGFHRLHGLGGLELDWQLNYARVQRTEPDIRDTRYFIADGTGDATLRVGQPNSAERFFLDLSEDSAGAGLNFAIPYRAFRFKAGGFGQLQSRFFDGRRLQYFGFKRTSTVGPAEEVLAPDGLGPGAGSSYFVTESTLVQDRYRSALGLYGGFALVEFKPFDQLRATAGVRVEGAQQTVSANSPFASGGGAIPDVLRRTADPLPVVNVTVSPTQKLNLRAGYALTLARPAFRELGPFLFFDMVRRRDTSGNPALEPTHIHHADLRAEYFASDDEVFAVSVFAKEFLRPIERTVIGQASETTFGFRNADGADLVGVELEARSTLGRLAPVLRTVRVGANASFIASRVRLDDTQGQLGGANRPLQGQSPWVVNASATWTHPTWGTEAGVFYNVYGPRLTEVAVRPVPDFVEQPFHKLDFTASQPFGPGFVAKLSVANALDQAVSIRQGNVEVFRTSPGVQLSASLAWAMPTPGEKR